MEVVHTRRIMYTTKISLLQKLAAGDEIGWEEFAVAYRPLIASVARRYGVAPEDADDIVQQTLLAVFNDGRFAYSPERNGKFRSWLGGIVRHKVSDIFRRRPPMPAYSPECADTQFEEIFMVEYRKHLLDMAISEMRVGVLPEAYEAFQLCVLRGLSDKDAAALLGVRPNTVTVRKRRCLEKLRNIVRRLNASDGEVGLEVPRS